MSAGQGLPVGVTALTPALVASAVQLATRLALPLIDLPETLQLAPGAFLLEVSEAGLQLRVIGESMRPLRVDFLAGSSGYRQSGTPTLREPLARAVGCRSGQRPRVLDATAGLGADSLFLARLGCQIELVERSPVVAELLRDGLQRALADPRLGPIISERVQFSAPLDALQLLRAPSWLEPPEVIYLDPMYPESGKRAQVKREMQLLRRLLATDSPSDEEALLNAAREQAGRRVVVKRPSYAEPFARQSPDQQISGRALRFDLYLR